MFRIMWVGDSDVDHFVKYWSAFYEDDNEDLYNQAIICPLSPKSIIRLFTWKNGGMRLASQKCQSVQDNYVARLNELGQLDDNTTARQFLEMFPRGGAIWRIFWLHCWKPDRFPIYDQHVHRAMMFITNGIPQEIGRSDKKKVQDYLQMYLPFFNENCPAAQFPDRQGDKALSAYGKLLKSRWRGMLVEQDGAINRTIRD
jgi:hypothetical protein